jgi:hypothetical protein
LGWGGVASSGGGGGGVFIEIASAAGEIYPLRDGPRPLETTRDCSTNRSDDSALGEADIQEVKLRVMQFVTTLAVGAVVVALGGWVRTHYVYDVVMLESGRVDVRAATWPGRVMVEYTHRSSGEGSPQVLHESGVPDQATICPAPFEPASAFAYHRETTFGGLFSADKTTTHVLIVPFWFLAAAPATAPLARFARHFWKRRVKGPAFPVTPADSER